MLLDNKVAISETEYNSTLFLIEESKKDPQNYRYLSEVKMQEIAINIKNHLTLNRSYLDRQYSLQQLAQELSIPAQYISAVINEFEKINFNDFINSYRVKYCLELLSNNDHQNQTLEAIAAESGFNNRNTFTIAFKKAMGQTPSTYIKNINSAKNV